MRLTLFTIVSAMIAFAAGCVHHGEQAYSPDEYYQQGLADENSGNVNRAMMHYGQAVDADPMHAASLHRLGVLYIERCDYDRAIPVFRKQVEATKGSADAWNDLGYCYEKSGQYLAAEGSYRHGITSNADSKICKTNLGLLLAREGHESEGLIHLQSAMSEADAHRNLAIIYREQGLNSRAELELAKVGQLEPNTVVSTDGDDEAAFELDDAEMDIREGSQPQDHEEQSAVDTSETPSETDLLINTDPH
ncbi:MAG TPA: tetratricopeptide repeat protein [Tepidisphaeraceae bacterium]|nr:tetratricopeptide repeat protein [Tepidisphaeraceae bacterium]